MFRKILFVSSLIVTNIAAATSFGEHVTITDYEPVIVMSGAGKNLTVISLDSTVPMAKVRKFFDLGANGAQQIDYVVNCANKSVALAGFQVTTSLNQAPSAAEAAPSFDDLSFYKPVLDIDRNAVNTACDKRLSMSETTQAN